MLIIYAFTLFVLLLITNYKWKRRRLERMMRQFDGPPLKPLFGNGFDFLGNPTGMQLYLRFGFFRKNYFKKKVDLKLGGATTVAGFSHSRGFSPRTAWLHRCDSEQILYVGT